VGHSIHRTSLKLQKLAQLAKRTSMFDDPAAEVNELTYVIKQDIQLLNASLVELQKLSARGQAEANKQSQDHTHTVVDSLRSRLKDATQDFKDVLTSRSDALKHHKERRQLFSATGGTEPEASLPLLRPPPSTSPPVPGSGGAGVSASSSGLPSSAGSLQQPAGGASTPAQLPSFLQQQQQQQLVVTAPQDTYMSSRNEALQNVERTIVELGGIFTKLSEMVSQQGQLAIRIDENMEDTLSNVSGAQAQLLRYLNTLSSNRWLVLKVLGVLLFFLVIFIVFIA
jgi:syntaxin 5